MTSKSLRLPNVIDNELPAQESVSSVKMYAARNVFAEIENSQTLNRALMTKVIPPFTVYKPGDIVNYKKERSDGPWQGPAAVIGSTGNCKTIFLSHGRFQYTVSQSRIVKLPKNAWTQVSTDTPTVVGV